MKPITPKMQEAIDFAKEHGNRLYRHPGGFWAGKTYKQWGIYFGTNTIHGLVTRKVAEYTDWKEGRNGRFPIEITLKAIEDKEDLPEGFSYATTEELALALGKSPDEAKAMQTRLERLAGNDLHIVED